MSPVLYAPAKLSEPDCFCPAKSHEWEWQTKPKTIAGCLSEGISHSGGMGMLLILRTWTHSRQGTMRQKKKRKKRKEKEKEKGRSQWIFLS